MTKSEPNSRLTVEEGESFKLNCEVDNFYKYCEFYHHGKFCLFEWKRDINNITVTECSDYADRMVWSGNYDPSKCAITISDARLEDARLWSCKLESYAPGEIPGYGYIVRSNFDIEVISKITNTATTTTTSTKRGKILLYVQTM